MPSIQLPTQRVLDALRHRYVRPALLQEEDGVLLFRCARREAPDIPVLVRAMIATDAAGVPSAHGMRFLREAEIGARLIHARIVTYSPVEIIDGVAMCEVSRWGMHPLAQTMRTHGPMSYDRILTVLGEVAEALDFAHSRDVLHGALSPAHVLVGGDGHVQLAGFMLYTHDATGHATIRPSQVGDPAYMAPEQRDDAPVDGSVDIYALGAIAYELCADRLRTAPDIAGQSRVLPFDLPAMHKFRADVPQHATAAIRRATNPNARLRFATAAEFVGAMAEPDEAFGHSLATFKPPIHYRPAAPWPLILLGLLIAAVCIVAASPTLRELVLRFVVGRAVPP